MNLHNDSEAFVQLISATARRANVSPFFIEKDYWITFALRQVFTSEHATYTVFKGGTSLSKAYCIIQRFSEDVDLAVFPTDENGTISGNKLKERLRAISKSCWQPPLKDGDPDRELRITSKNRNSRLLYPRQNFGAGVEAAGDVELSVRLEITGFTIPDPTEMLPVSSLIHSFLYATQQDEEISMYGLEPFDVQVLSYKRTFFEKLAAIIRLAAQQNEAVPELKRSIRHFYDIYHLKQAFPELTNILQKKDYSLLKRVLGDDLQTFRNQTGWQKAPFAELGLFANPEAIWRSLRQAYQQMLNALNATDSPTDEQLIALLHQLAAYLAGYDARRND